MKAVVRWEMWADRVNVFIIEDGWGAPRTLVRTNRVGDDINDLEWREFEEGTEPTPLLRVSPEVAKVLADALAGHASKIPATEDALNDTRTVRDRLLALVEQLTTERSA